MADRTVAISGASGLVGGALCRHLADKGWQVLRLVRGAGDGEDEVTWDPVAGTIATERLEGVDAVVHLAGENVASGRWTAARMGRIRDSRVQGTGLLARTLAGLRDKPRVFAVASATGFYGDRGDEMVDEGSPPGEGFLSDVCQQWEAAADPARDAGIRTVHLRIGLVLAREGGALKKMLPPFRFGLGGRLGSGAQHVSWITLPDLVRAFEFAIAREELEGPVLAVGPQPVTNARFTKTLGRVLKRPAILPAPAFALRLLLGREMADGLLLSSLRATPKRLLDAGFRFQDQELEQALRSCVE